jgi:hypothetical protein
VDDRHVWRAKEIVVFQRLPGIGSLVAARNAQRIVKLKAALAASIEIDAFVFARKRKIGVMRGAGGRFPLDQFAEALLCLSACDQNPPRLAVAP